MDQRDALGDIGKAITCDRESAGVAIDADQSRLRTGAQESATVPAETDGGVHQDRARLLQRWGE
jgi:hypothetical protein